MLVLLLFSLLLLMAVASIGLLQSDVMAGMTPLYVYLSPNTTSGNFSVPPCALPVVHSTAYSILLYPSLYAFHPRRPVYYNDQCIARQWLDLLSHKTLPFKEPLWTGYGFDCNQWTGVGVGTIGQQSLRTGTFFLVLFFFFLFAHTPSGEVPCTHEYRVLCLVR